MGSNRQIFNPNLEAMRADGSLFRDPSAPRRPVPRLTARMSAVKCDSTDDSDRVGSYDENEDVEDVEKQVPRNATKSKTIGLKVQDGEEHGDDVQFENGSVEEVAVLNVERPGKSSLQSYSSSSDDEEQVGGWERKVLLVKKAKKVARRHFKGKNISKYDVGVLARFVKFTEVNMSVTMDMSK